MSTASNEPAASASSLYGYDLGDYVRDHARHHASAFATARYVVTHGDRNPDHESSIGALGLYDRAVFELLATRPELPVSCTCGADPHEHAMSVNALGRLHIRPVGAARPIYDPGDTWLEIGYVSIDPALHAQIAARHAALVAREAEAHARIKAALDEVHRRGELPKLLASVIDHISHVESVCFFVGDRFFARIDRYVNLIDSKEGSGFLPPLAARPYAEWTADDVLIVASLHALFLSGRSVRFEEFNGTALSAAGVIGKLEGLRATYAAADGAPAPAPIDDVFALGRAIREQTVRGVGKSWMRYRVIYGLTFQKREQVLATPASTEDPEAHLREFAEDYEALACGRLASVGSEHMFFLQLACACLTRDLLGVRRQQAGSAAAGWTEALMERIVGSAVLATDSDYGMSSSIRSISELVEYDEDKLIAFVHSLSPQQFFTCFVSSRFGERLDAATASAIATSVQRRMMFNRWHFIPGNLGRELVSESRHWYYPPLVPDIAIHSDVHRAGHSRARVKFSIRAPGPDMSRPPLQIADGRYRGFYDVRVVRMSGEPYTTEHMLRVRRRTQWLEAVYAVIAAHMQGRNPLPFAVRGFEPGNYLDLTSDRLPRLAIPNSESGERSVGHLRPSSPRLRHNDSTTADR